MPSLMAMSTRIRPVEQYENALCKKVREEEEKEADAPSVKIRVQNVYAYGFENQFQQAYIVAKYNQFREQVAKKIGCNLAFGPVVNDVSQFHIEQDILVGKRKDTFKTVTFLVHFNEESKETNCNCRLFESKGMVCTHMISVWSKKKLEVMPEKYILRRWRKNLVRSHTKVKVSFVNWECKPEFGRYDNLFELFNKAAYKAMYSTAKTERMAARLREIEAENDSYNVECLSNMPTVGESLSDRDVYPQLLLEQTSGKYESTVNDPSKDPQRGQMPAKRKK